ncbi:peptidoglycan D,D-transpeptidase FtsI family protein [Patescibacteria group bacterium]
MPKKRNKGIGSMSISPDEIFLDSENIPNFDSYQLEGRMERPIGSKVFLFLGIIFLVIGSFLVWRIGYLQISQGVDFSRRSESNHLRFVTLFPERGIIYDRNDIVLAWNTPAFFLVLEKEAFTSNDLRENLEDFLIFLEKDNYKELIKNSFETGQDLIVESFYDWEEVSTVYRQWSYLPIRIEQVSSRSYKDGSGLAHVVGYLGYSSSADYEDVVGKAGIENSYEDVLSGEKGFKITEVDSLNEIKSEGIQKFPVSGKSVKLSIDHALQGEFYRILSLLSTERGFQGGAGVILDVNNGEVLSMVSFPEYDSQVLSNGGPNKLIQSYIDDPQKPFLNRAFSGLYTPGSIVKPFVALAALMEGVVDPLKSIFSSGSISIPNPYFPDRESVFLDWKAHGWVDMERALAVSSNEYFYSIGGGYEDISGLGIRKINEYMKLFGFGEKTNIDLFGEEHGFVPNADSKKDGTDSVWRIGDTYHVSIGQGSFQITALQAAVATAVLANEGVVFEPTLISGKVAQREVLKIPYNYFEIVKKGMRRAVNEGTASALSSAPVHVAAKTGTAEIGSGKYVNSWVIGFWPYEKPRFAISVVLEKGRSSNLVGGVYAFSQLLNWMQENAPEYLLD